MKKLLIVGLLVAALSFGLSGVAMASGAPVPVDVTASATVVVPLTVTRDFDLEFGTLVHGATDVILPATLGAGGSAQVTVAGLIGAHISVTVPAAVDIVLGVNTMSVTLDHAATSGDRVLDAAGNWVVLIGGTVTAAALQAPGVYTGIFVVSAVYL